MACLSNKASTSLCGLLTGKLLKKRGCDHNTFDHKIVCAHVICCCHGNPCDKEEKKKQNKVNAKHFKPALCRCGNITNSPAGFKWANKRLTLRHGFPISNTANFVSNECSGPINPRRVASLWQPTDSLVKVACWRFTLCQKNVSQAAGQSISYVLQHQMER